MLRAHIDGVLDADPETKLIVYGDFNDTKNAAGLKEVLGERKSDRGLKDLLLKDDAGETWTEYWKAADVYSRIDYVLVTPNLQHAFDYSASHIDRSPYWSDASDHRALVTVFNLDRAQ